MPLEDGAAIAHPAVEALPPVVEIALQSRAVRRTGRKAVDAALGKAGGEHYAKLCLQRVRVHGLPGLCAQVLPAFEAAAGCQHGGQTCQPAGGAVGVGGRRFPPGEIAIIEKVQQGSAYKRGWGAILATLEQQRQYAEETATDLDSVVDDAPAEEAGYQAL